MFRLPSVFVPLAAFGAAVLCLYASRTDKRIKPDHLETSQTITATILRLEELLDEAESHHHVATVDALIADDYRGITVGGETISKRDVLAQVSGEEEATSQSSNREVRPLENAAVYTALVLDRGIDQKTQEPYILSTRVTDIWQKRGQEWKLVNDQATGVSLNAAPQYRP